MTANISPAIIALAFISPSATASAALPVLAAAAAGSIFAELSLRSWRELALYIFQKRGGEAQKAEPETVQPIEKRLGVSSSSNLAERRGGLFRFLLLKTAALTMLLLFFATLKQAPAAVLPTFFVVYIVYLFGRGWSQAGRGP